MKTCSRPPAGWHCTRQGDHTGPCAAVKDPTFKEFAYNALGFIVIYPIFKFVTSKFGQKCLYQLRWGRWPSKDEASYG